MYYIRSKKRTKVGNFRKFFLHVSFALFIDIYVVKKIYIYKMPVPDYQPHSTMAALAINLEGSLQHETSVTHSPIAYVLICICGYG